MRRNLLPLLLGLALGLLAARFFLGQRTPSAPVTPAPASATPPVAETAIQDGKTIDFSSGQPRVQDTPEDRAALEKAKREMDEAAKDVIFAPTKTAPTETKP